MSNWADPFRERLQLLTELLPVMASQATWPPSRDEGRDRFWLGYCLAAEFDDEH